MILLISTTKASQSISAHEIGEIDIAIDSNCINKSTEQLEHIIDFLVEVYGRDEVKSYMRRTYDCDE